jgi:hypothetical protein
MFFIDYRNAAHTLKMDGVERLIGESRRLRSLVAAQYVKIQELKIGTKELLAENKKLRDIIYVLKGRLRKAEKEKNTGDGGKVEGSASGIEKVNEREK